MKRRNSFGGEPWIVEHRTGDSRNAPIWESHNENSNSLEFGGFNMPDTNFDSVAEPVTADDGSVAASLVPDDPTPKPIKSALYAKLGAAEGEKEYQKQLAAWTREQSKSNLFTSAPVEMPTANLVKDYKTPPINQDLKPLDDALEQSIVANAPTGSALTDLAQQLDEGAQKDKQTSQAAVNQALKSTSSRFEQIRSDMFDNGKLDQYITTTGSGNKVIDPDKITDAANNYNQMYGGGNASAQQLKSFLLTAGDTMLKEPRIKEAAQKILTDRGTQNKLADDADQKTLQDYVAQQKIQLKSNAHIISAQLNNKVSQFKSQFDADTQPLLAAYKEQHDKFVSDYVDQQHNEAGQILIQKRDELHTAVESGQLDPALASQQMQATQSAVNMAISRAPEIAEHQYQRQYADQFTQQMQPRLQQYFSQVRDAAASAKDRMQRMQKETSLRINAQAEQNMQKAFSRGADLSLDQAGIYRQATDKIMNEDLANDKMMREIWGNVSSAYVFGREAASKFGGWMKNIGNYLASNGVGGDLTDFMQGKGGKWEKENYLYQPELSWTNFWKPDMLAQASGGMLGQQLPNITLALLTKNPEVMGTFNTLNNMSMMAGQGYQNVLDQGGDVGEASGAAHDIAMGELATWPLEFFQAHVMVDALKGMNPIGKAISNQIVSGTLNKLHMQYSNALQQVTTDPTKEFDPFSAENTQAGWQGFYGSMLLGAGMELAGSTLRNLKSAPAPDAQWMSSMIQNGKSDMARMVIEHAYNSGAIDQDGFTKLTGQLDNISQKVQDAAALSLTPAQTQVFVGLSHNIDEQAARNETIKTPVAREAADKALKAKKEQLNGVIDRTIPVASIETDAGLKIGVTADQVKEMMKDEEFESNVTNGKLKVETDDPALTKTLDKNKEEAQLKPNEKLVAEAIKSGKIPDILADVAKADPDKFLKMVADQSFGRTEDGSISNLPDADYATRQQYGDEIVNRAKALFPIEQQNNIQNASTEIAGPQQESNQQSGILEHQGAESERNQATQPETNSGNSGIGGPSQEITPATPQEQPISSPKTTSNVKTKKAGQEPKTGVLNQEGAEQKSVTAAEPAPSSDKAQAEFAYKNSYRTFKDKYPGVDIDEYNDLRSEHAKNVKLSDKLRKAADALRKPLGEGLQSDISGIPRHIIAAGLDILAKAIDAGEAVTDAVKKAIAHVKANSSQQDETKIYAALMQQMGEDVFGSSVEQLPQGKAPDAPAEPKENYSVFGRQKEVFVRNLEQLKQYAKDVMDMASYRAVKKYFTSKAQSSVMFRTAVNKITSLVGKEGWSLLREALIASRLRGIKQRWENWSQNITGRSDDDMETLFEDGKQSMMYNVLHDLDGGIVHDNDPAKTVFGLVSNKEYDAARQYMSDLFSNAAAHVTNMDHFTNGLTFDDMVKDGKFTDPKMQQALEAYQANIEKPLNESHASNDGIFSDAKGPLDTYYPLTPTERPSHLVSSTPAYKKPINAFNNFATGHSENYSADAADLSTKLARAIRTNNKANAIQALTDAKLIQPVTEDSPDDGTINLSGEIFAARKVKVGDSRMIVQDGNTVHTPSKYALMPDWLYKELRPAFEEDGKFDEFSLFGKLNNTLVRYQLGGPIEAAGHSMRLLGGLVNSMPFMQEWAYKHGFAGKLGGVIANNYFTKMITGFIKIASTDISSGKALATIQQMAKEGYIPEKTWSKTWSKEYAELTGAKHVGDAPFTSVKPWKWAWDFSPILYGKRGFDLKARVLMYRLVNAMEPNATPEQHSRMQAQLGEYTRAMQGEIERVVKKHGIAPFFSFASAIYREGVRAVFGSGKLPITRPSIQEAMTTGIGAQQAIRLGGYKAAQLITGGLFSAVGTWIGLYKAQTGKYPWEDEHSKLMRLPFPEWAKNTPLAKTMFFNKKNGEWDDIDMNFFNPYLKRGLMAVGAPKVYETKMLGGTTGQAIEAGQIQALNTAVSPFVNNPIAQVGFKTFTGSAPYLTGIRDDRGRVAPQLFRSVRTEKPGVQMGANFLEALLETNPVVEKGYHSVAPLFGTGTLKPSYDSRDENAVSMMNMVFNLAFPRLNVPHGNDDARAKMIQKQPGAIEKTMEQEDGAPAAGRKRKKNGFGGSGFGTGIGKRGF